MVKETCPLNGQMIVVEQQLVKYQHIVGTGFGQCWFF
jgi:hypothetical protein